MTAPSRRRAADLSPEELAARRAAEAQYKRDLYAKDPEKYKTRVAKARRERYQRLKESVLDLLGRVCSSCGFMDCRALQIDHIDGGGRAERVKISSEQMLRRVLAEPTRFQMLCANCHQIKTLSA